MHIKIKIDKKMHSDRKSKRGQERCIVRERGGEGKRDASCDKERKIDRDVSDERKKVDSERDASKERGGE